MIDDKVNVAKLIDQISSKKPDLVEFRLDKLHEPRLLEEIVNSKSFPVIATDKSDSGSVASLGLLLHAAAAGFDLVDIELATASSDPIVRKLKSHGSEVIVSFHDYARTPPSEELTKLLQVEKKIGADVCKIVTTAVKPGDNLTILRFVEEESTNTRLVSFAMGPRGMPSRILSPLFGAEFTFAAISDESKTADGQLSVDSLRMVWQALEIQ
jgi:3-dehydroquinate dehydratase type I